MQTTVGAVLSVRLLGELELRLGDRPLPPLESARAESLLAYLLIHRDAPQPRQRIAFLLWPDSSEAQARTNLRHLLHKLRHALPDADRFLEVTARTLRWRPEAPARLDLADFEAALDRADTAADPIGDLEAAAGAYGGDLLEGSYDEWLLTERDRVRDLVIAALDRLTALLERRGEHARAVAHAERLLRLDPLREETYRLLMRLHDARGDRARALRAYHACAAVLERDLGVEPSASTREAHEALLPGAADREPERAVFVGRLPERRRLTELWRESARGRAQLVLVTGDAGIGKSRLLEELQTFCAHRGAATAAARSYPAEGALAYGPVAEWLRSEPLAARRNRLDRGRLTELARVLPELDEAPRALPENEQRQRLSDALAHAIEVAEPLLLIADDLHWCDPETLQFLHFLVRSRPGARLLIAATARLEELDDAPALKELLTGLRALDRATEIALPPLSRAETAVLAERLTRERIDAERLFAETDGNPLFIVETLRAGAPAPRVQAVIEARLAQLSEPARHLAAVAAAVGREFTADVLAQASGATEDELVHGLDELWRRRIVRDRGPGGIRLRAREAARGRLPGVGARRAEPHAPADRPRAAGARSRAPCAPLRSFRRRGRGSRALPARRRRRAPDARAPGRGAGARARARAGGRARAAARDSQRPARTARCGRGLRVTAPRRAAPARARSRARARRRPRTAAAALTGAHEHRSARRRRLPSLRPPAARPRDRRRRPGPHRRGRLRAGNHRVLAGRPRRGPEPFRGGRRPLPPPGPRHAPDHYGFDTRVICLSRLANTLWYLGDAGAAADARDRALALADEVGDPWTTGITLVFAALLALEQDDVERLRAYTARLGDYDLPALEIPREAYLGYLEVLDGGRGIRRIRRAIEATSGKDPAPGTHAVLARILVEACVIAGDRSGLDVPVPAGLFEQTVRQLQGTLAERTAADPAPP